MEIVVRTTIRKQEDRWVIETDRRHEGRGLLMLLREEFSSAAYAADGYNIVVNAGTMDEATVLAVASELINHFYDDGSVFRARQVQAPGRECDVLIRANRTFSEEDQIILIGRCREVPGAVNPNFAFCRVGSELEVSVANRFFGTMEVAKAVIEVLYDFAAPLQPR